jgi:hypothetical protein
VEEADPLSSYANNSRMGLLYLVIAVKIDYTELVIAVKKVHLYITIDSEEF